MDRGTVNSLLSKSINSPRRRLSLVQSVKKNNSTISTAGRSSQSVQIICRTSNHIVQNFGSSLPVLVTEALTFLERNTAISVNVSLDGWAWLVCGRRLLVWQCKSTIHDQKQQRTFKTQCRELLLPQSDLAHKAECIAVWLPTGQNVPSCMAVSPEGTVRYWSSIANEELSIETNAELAGQEVDCLSYTSDNQCILATTTCTVALLQPQYTGGRGTINCRVLRTSQGWLGGIGRKMSSLIFGAIPQSPVLETKLTKVVCTGMSEKGSSILILAGNSLQYWSFPVGEQEKMEFEEDIGHIVTQSFQRRLWDSSSCNPQHMVTWMIDMQQVHEGIVVLMAAHCAEISPQIHFAVGLIPMFNNLLTNSFKWFIPIKIGPIYYNEDLESIIHLYHFIISGWEIIVYNQHNVIVVSNLSEYEQDKIDLTRGGKDSILGGALCSGSPVLFTKNHGLITITPTDFITQDFNQSYSDINLSMDCGENISQTDHFVTLISNDEIQEMFHSSDGVRQLQAAFLLSVRQNKEQADEILMELFPLQKEPVIDVDAFLDSLVLKVAKYLIDDYPANDPRWANYRDLTFTLNAVLDMQIPRQLERKQKSMDLYISFLKEHSLWNRFCAVTYKGIVVSTSHVLGEFAEKIIAKLTIYNLQQRYTEIIDTVIKRSLQPESFISEYLTSNDIFYREVSETHLFLINLIETAVEQSNSEKATQQIAQYILQVNSILLAVLHEVIKYRQYNAEKFIPPRCSSITEYLPWTASTGKYGLRTCLTKMQNLTLQYGVNNTNDLNTRNELYEQLVGLIDLILDGKKCYLESIRGTDKFEILLKQYETERTSLIQPLIKQEQYENAAMLAEKYCDFASLIQICELTKNKNRLDSYMEQFASQDFAGFLFAWFVKDGRQGQLVERCRRGGANELTEKLLQDPILSWVQASLSDEYEIAAKTLYRLAVDETELVTRKKSMFSLAKLSLLSSDDAANKFETNIKKIDNELNLIAHQEDVPVHVLEIYGYDIDRLRVLSPSELINLYTCVESQICNEYDFKKALDLLEYILQEDEKMYLRLKIWARAARNDKWDIISKNPEQQVQNTIFFKLLDLVHMMGNKIEDMLPSIKLLLAEEELGDLAASNNFQYLIKLVYEYAYNNY